MHTLEACWCVSLNIILFCLLCLGSIHHSNPQQRLCGTDNIILWNIFGYFPHSVCYRFVMNENNAIRDHISSLWEVGTNHFKITFRRFRVAFNILTCHQIMYKIVIRNILIHWIDYLLSYGIWCHCDNFSNDISYK